MATKRKLEPYMSDDERKNHPFKVPNSVGRGGAWDWPKVIEELAERMVENPIGGLLHAIKNDYVDEEGRKWKMPTKSALYRAAQRRTDVTNLLRDARTLHAMSLYDNLFERIESTPDFVADTSGKGDRQNSAGMSKLRLFLEHSYKYLAAWYPTAAPAQKVEYSTSDGKSLTDIIKDGMPKLEDFKK